MRKALVVGIDDYPASPLAGCVNDAQRMAELLSRHHDDAPNFECRTVVSSNTTITRPSLKELINELFSADNEVALFYFAGHGTFNNLGGYIVTPDAKRYDEGVSMTDVLTMVNKSQAHESRSEEHTSELQSPDHLVCRLLLEKKKNQLRMSEMGSTPEICKVIRYVRASYADVDTQ